MKNKTAALSLSCLFFVYVILCLFNSLYWSVSYEENALVRTLGEITDGEALEVLWIPGQIPGFLLSMIAGQDLTIVSALLTFAVGVFFIMKVFKVSWLGLNSRRTKTETN